MHNLKTIFVAAALIAALFASVGSGPALAGGQTPICLLVHPSGTQPIKVDLSDTCGGITGSVTYQPKGKSQNRTLQVEGSGAGVTVGQDTYCQIQLQNDNNGVLIATFNLKLHITKDGGKPAYTSVDYDISFVEFGGTENEQFKGSEKIMRCN